MALEKSLDHSRCPSGIEGLDHIIGGGFPCGGVVHISGTCGSGKTSLAVEFLVRGAVQGQKGMMIVTNLSPDNVMQSVTPFDAFDEKMVKDKTLRFVHAEQMLEKLSHPQRPIIRDGALEFLHEIEMQVEKHGIKRLVIDSVTPLLMDMEPPAARDFVRKLSEVMRARGCTTMLLSDSDAGSEQYIPCDGAIKLFNLDRHGTTLRVLQVIKMAGAEHSRSHYVFDITRCGMLLTPLIRSGLH